MKQFLIFLLVYCQLFVGLPAWSEQRILTADIVEGQDSGKNYMGNKGHFEKNVNAVSAYADAAGVSAVDGTGGSPTVTCTRSTSSPISGDGMLLITKDAANRQGQGCSVNFSIDSGDKYSMQMIDFKSIVVSGTFAAGTASTDSDIVVQIYDVTNAAIIPVQGTGRIYSNSTTMAESFRGYFQASSSTSYRLIWHVGSTSSSAYAVAVDNVKVSKSAVAVGAVITDWVAWTPTGSWSTNTTYTGLKRRVGTDGEYKIKIALAGAPTSANLTVNLPSGEVIDTTKMIDTNANNDFSSFGQVNLLDNGSANYIGGLSYNNSTSLQVRVIGDAAGSYIKDVGAATQAVPATFGNTDLITMSFKVPIAGWGGTTQISDGYDSRRIDLQLSTNAGAVATSATTWTSATFSTPEIDDVAAWNASDTATIRSAGDYEIGFMACQNSAAANYFRIGYQKNADSEVVLGQGVGKSGGSACPFASKVLRLAVNDTIKFKAFTEGTEGIGATRSAYIKKIQAPTTISMSELISAGYSISGDKSPSGNAAIDFDTKLWDTHNAVTTGGSGVWKFTAPAPGIYQMCIAVYTSSGSQTVDVYKNGVQNKVLGPVNSTSVNSHCTSISLIAGDYISANPDGGVTFTGPKNNNVYITRMK